MTATSYIDAACLGALVRAYLRLEENGIELRVATIDARTRWMMANFGQDQVFRVFDTLPEAVTARPKRWSLYRQAA
jgi:anti-anti-sigma regulatory factor